eukprot:365990-Chlamydomonas_euryale.AAC.30
MPSIPTPNASHIDEALRSATRARAHANPHVERDVGGIPASEQQPQHSLVQPVLEAALAAYAWARQRRATLRTSGMLTNAVMRRVPSSRANGASAPATTTRLPGPLKAYR